MSRGLRYRVTRKLAQGGMAEIFLARQVGAEGFEKSVVLKRILPALAADPGFVRMLVDEAHIASTLNHSHLVQVLDLGKAGDQFFLALEFVDGFSLEQIRQRARKARMKMPLPLALYVVSSLCRGLDYAHRRTRNGKPLGIVHRDVTPQNVLVGREGDVKLADFGIAKARGRREKSATGVIKGKFAYMSPEQSIGGELDARSDLFSVGTLLYVLTTGKKPFEGTTDLDVLMQVRRARFEKPSTLVKDYNLDVEKFIIRALRADKAKRWQSAEQMADRLDAILFKIGQPTGPAALKRWLELLCSRDGVRFPGDLRDEPDVSNETIQLTSDELELELLPREEGNEGSEEDEFSISPTQAATWKRVPAPEPDGMTRGMRKTGTVIATVVDAMCVEKAPDEVDELLAAPEPEPGSEPENEAESDDGLGEYEFTLDNPLPGTGHTFTGEQPAEATELVDVQTTVIVGQPDREPAREPAPLPALKTPLVRAPRRSLEIVDAQGSVHVAPSEDDEPEHRSVEPITALSTVDGAALSAQPIRETHGEVEPSLIDVAAATMAAPEAAPAFVAQVARRAPADPTLVLEPIPARAHILPVATPVLARAPAGDSSAPVRTSARPLRTGSASPLWAAELDDSSPRRPARRGFVARTVTATSKAAAVVVLTATAAGVGAYAARPYLPPWIASNPLVQHVDTWIADVPDIAERVSERARRAF